MVCPRYTFYTSRKQNKARVSAIQNLVYAIKLVETEDEVIWFDSKKLGLGLWKSGSVIINYPVLYFNQAYFENNWRAPLDVVIAWFYYFHAYNYIQI